jgi:hypothetical protein
MAKNTVQFQKGMSLPEFLKNYASEALCVNIQSNSQHDHAI